MAEVEGLVARSKLADRLFVSASCHLFASKFISSTVNSCCFRASIDSRQCYLLVAAKKGLGSVHRVGRINVSAEIFMKIEEASRIRFRL